MIKEVIDRWTWRRLVAAAVLVGFAILQAGSVAQATGTLTYVQPFAQSHAFYQAKVTGAKANIGTSTNTNAVAIISAGNIGGANQVGLLIDGITAIPNNTITASWACVYYSSDAGTTLQIFSCGTITAYTAAATLGPTALSFNAPNGNAISPSNPVYLPYSANGAVYGAIGVAVTDGVIFTIHGTNL